MEKNKKIIIVAAILVVAIVVYMFWPNIKAMFTKKEDTNTNNVPVNPNQSVTNTTVTNPIKPIQVGDSVLAAKDLVKAFDKGLNAVVKTYQKGAWIGVVQKNANGWLTVMDTAGNLKMVQKSNVKRM